jgi:hypothetical protein
MFIFTKEMAGLLTIIHKRTGCLTHRLAGGRWIGVQPLS